MNFDAVEDIKENFRQDLTVEQMATLVGSTLNIEDVCPDSETAFGYIGEIVAVDVMITHDRNSEPVIRWVVFTEDDMVLPVTNTMKWQFVKGPI